VLSAIQEAVSAANVRRAAGTLVEAFARGDAAGGS
jgi:hypothetical protein